MYMVIISDSTDFKNPCPQRISVHRETLLCNWLLISYFAGGMKPTQFLKSITICIPFLILKLQTFVPHSGSK